MGKFPKLEHGSCDGLGCSWSGMECFCDEYLWMREEYQRVYDKPWDTSTLECQIWDECWRKNWKRYIEEPAEKREVAKRIERDKQFRKSIISRMERIDALEKEADENSRIKIEYNDLRILTNRCKYTPKTMVGSIFCSNECENIIDIDESHVKCKAKRQEFIEARHLARLRADTKQNKGKHENSD